jgi:uncharacterized protein (DUF885 family)
MLKVVAAVVLALLAAGCGGRNPDEQLADLSDRFVNTTLSFSPSSATGVGLHQYQGQELDNLLDDFSPAGLDKQRQFYEDFRSKLGALNAGGLTAEGRADLILLQDQAAANLLELSEIHTTMHNPTLYVEVLGNALYNCFVLEYAPKPDRMRNIIARLEKAPGFLNQAAINLRNSTDVWTGVAVDENQGNIDLVDKAIRAAVPADLAEAYSAAAAPALAAMRKFQDYLKNSLSNRNDYDWRLGADKYKRKFAFVMESGVDATDMLTAAERDLQKVRAQMLEIALPLHKQMLPAHTEHSDLAGDERENRVVGEVLDKIAERHSTRESYMDDARKDLDEARAFVEAKRLMTLPGRGNLQVIPTPEFMRGGYPVGGFSPAPPLEPKLGAFYWVTPIPADWPRDKVESKLREYNFYKLKLLTIHEAMPGHYVQAEVASGVEPRSRRVLRSVLGNGPYIEGWAEYSEQAMLDEGFLNHAPEMELTFAKEQLRVISNAILDIRLQMLNMSDQEAFDLMEKRTFQEHTEAVEKLQRAKLSSCQLPTYYVGFNAWLKLRDDYKRSKGGAFNLAEFHDRALKVGAVSMTGLRSVLGL